jgi:hypothetical protein
MPRRDRTGPEGEGPMTGWGAGYCADQPTWGYAGAMPGRRTGGRGGRSRSRRWRHWFYATGLPRWARFGPAPDWAPPIPEQETEALKAQAEWLQGELATIHQRLGELEQAE